MSEAFEEKDDIYDYDYSGITDREEAYELISKHYEARSFDDSTAICEWIATIKLPDLTIEDVVWVYARLYRFYEGDYVVRYNLDDGFIEDLAEY